MRMIRAGATAAALGVVALSVPACNSAPLRIGALYPTTGTQSAGGTEEERGARLAVDWVNAHGGVRGRTVRLDPVDAPRAEAVPAALAKLRRDGVDIVLGSHGSSISAVVAAEARKDNLVFFETGAVGAVPPASAGGTNFFRLAPMGANLGRAGIDFVTDELGPRLNPANPQRYAVAAVDDEYGRAVGGGAAAEIAKRGHTLVGTFNYDATKTDWAALARQIAAVHPDVLYVSAYVDDGVALRQAFVDAHIPLAASIGTSSSYCHPAFGARLGDAAVGLFASDKPDGANVRADALRPEGRAVLAWVQQRYHARYRADMSAPALSGFSHAYAVLAHILPKARSFDARAVAAAAVRTKLALGSLPNGAGLDMVAPGAPDAGENRAASSVIWEWVAPKTRAVVWPPAFATHALVPLVPEA